MGFWHRNIDAHEIIFCVKGALKWETEMGVKIMHPGDMLFIPKGIGHRSMLCEDSTDDNVLIELKIADELTYVGRRQEVMRVVSRRHTIAASAGSVVSEGRVGVCEGLKPIDSPTPAPHRCSGGAEPQRLRWQPYRELNSVVEIACKLSIFSSPTSTG